MNTGYGMGAGSSFNTKPAYDFSNWGQDLLPQLAAPGEQFTNGGFLGETSPTWGGTPGGGALNFGGGGGGLMDSMKSLLPGGFLSTKDQQGWGSPAIGAASGIFNAVMAMKQYGMAKDTLAENKKQFAANFGAQRNAMNANLAGKQGGLVGSAPAGTYQSVGDYMKEYGVKNYG